MLLASPPNESERLAALRSYRIVGSSGEGHFAEIVAAAQRHFVVPIAAVHLIDDDLQWTKAAIGPLPGITSRESSICGHTILSDDLFVVEDAHKDERFAENPIVVAEPFIRFYAGAPLIDRNGYRLGAVCVLDTRPRRVSAEDAALLESLAYRAMRHIELHKLRLGGIRAVGKHLLALADGSQAAGNREAAALDLDLLRAHLDEREAWAGGARRGPLSTGQS